MGAAARALLCVGLAGAVSGCADAPGATFTLGGSYVVYGERGADFSVSGTRCAGAGDARGIAAGTPVTVTDVQDTTLATGSLRGGRFVAMSGSRRGLCSFTLTVTEVPDGRPFYRLVVGGRRIDQFGSAEAHRRLALAFYPP